MITTTKITTLMLFVLFFYSMIPVFAQNASADIESGIQNLADQIVENLNANNKKKVAVVEFSNLDGKVTELGKFIAEELITKLFRTKKFNVVERQLLNKVLKEQGLTLSGLIDPKSAVAIGRILGVDAIATGTITDLVTNIKINARMISTTDGSLFAVADSKVPKDQTVIQLMEKSTPASIEILPDNKTKQDFSKENYIEDHFNREILGAQWNKKRGDWFLVEGMLAQNDGNVFSLITVGKKAWKGFKLHIKAKKISGREGFVIGVKLKKSGEALVWNIGAANNTISVLQTYLNLISMRGPTVKYQNIPGTQKRFTADEDVWYDIKVVVKGATLKCYLNDQLMINMMDPIVQKFNRGRIFLGTYLTRAYFDDLTIYAIE